MENLNSVRSLVEENYMASADLHDAYFTVNVRPEFRNIFVLFERWTLRIASLMSLLQLLESLPSFLKTNFSKLRSEVLVSVFYFNDSWLIGKSYEDCIINANETCKLLAETGF